MIIITSNYFRTSDRVKEVSPSADDSADTCNLSWSIITDVPRMPRLYCDWNYEHKRRFEIVSSGTKKVKLECHDKLTIYTVILERGDSKR